jgi:hypothetical protein
MFGVTTLGQACVFGNRNTHAAFAFCRPADGALIGLDQTSQMASGLANHAFAQSTQPVQAVVSLPRPSCRRGCAALTPVAMSLGLSPSLLLQTDLVRLCLP